MPFVLVGGSKTKPPLLLLQLPFRRTVVDVTKIADDGDICSSAQE